MWHVSIASLRKNSAPVLVSNWGHGTFLAAGRLAKDYLRGVGEGETLLFHKPGFVALHVRRALSDSEMKMLSPEWLAIPAVHEFTEDGGIEARL